MARSPLWWHMPNAGKDLWRQGPGAPKTGKSLQIGDSLALHGQALPPDFGSLCQALEFSRNRNWDHCNGKIYAVVTVTS